MASAPSVGLQAKSPPNNVPSLPLPQVEMRQLQNGLGVLVQSDFTAPVVSIQFWCATGSIHESPWLGAGLSHLLEHLMFKGTPTRGNSQLAQQIQDLGGHLNAYTSFDRTVYHVDLPSDHALPAMEILGDAIFNSTIPAEEYDKEMEVIRREFAMGRDNPDSELGRLIFQTAFTRHPYRHPVIGYLDLFNQITRDDVLAYYHDRYAPQNLTLIVCGAIDPETTFRRASDLFEKIPRRRMGDVYLPEEPLQHARRELRQPFATELTRVALVYPIGGLDDDDTPALDLLATLAGGGRSSRLNQSCVEKLGLAEQLEAFAYAPPGHGLWGVEARCAPEKEKELLSEIRRQLDLFKTTAPDPAELDRAKRQSLLHQVHSQKTMSGKAASLGRGWIFQRDPHFSARYHARIQKVTPDEIHAVARKYFHPERETLVSLVPKKEAAAAAAEVAPVTKAATPELISLGGPKRALYMPQTTLPLLSLRAVLPGGLPSEPADQAGLGRLASHLLTKGTRHRNAEKLALEIEQLGGSLNSDAGNNSATLSLELLSPDWKPGLDLFLEMLTEAAPTEAELQIEKRKQLSLLQAERDYPMAAARDLIRASLYPGHAYGRKNLGTEETIGSITLKDVSAYQSSQLLTQEMVLAVTGPTAPAEWREIHVHRHGVPSPAKPRRAAPFPFPDPEGNRSPRKDRRRRSRPSFISPIPPSRSPIPTKSRSPSSTKRSPISAPAFSSASARNSASPTSSAPRNSSASKPATSSSISAPTPPSARKSKPSSSSEVATLAQSGLTKPEFDPRQAPRWKARTSSSSKIPRKSPTPPPSTSSSASATATPRSAAIAPPPSPSTKSTPSPQNISPRPATPSPPSPQSSGGISLR